MSQKWSLTLSLSVALLLAGCGATNTPCDVTDAELDAYVIADLGITRLVPMRRASSAEIAELCKGNPAVNPIGCTVWNKALVLDSLSGSQRINIRAHEWFHVHQFQRWAANWTGASTINEPEAYAYGDKIMKEVCS